MDINYITSEENPVDIIRKNFSESELTKNAKRIKKEDIWELVETGRENVKNNGVVDGVTDFDSTEYSSHSLTNPADQTNGIE